MPYQEPVGILGFGKEGQSTLKFLIQNGVQQILILDQNEVELAPEFVQNHGIKVFSGSNYLNGLDKCQTLFRSAGVYPRSEALLKWQATGGVLTSQIQEFCKLWPNKILAVTGTLGKGTTIMMAAEILRMAGVSHIVGGNFGVPALDLLAEKADYALLELSSFQLMDTPISPDWSIVLKTTIEHLDWHKDLKEYRYAKSFIWRNQKATGKCAMVGNTDGSKQVMDGCDNMISIGVEEGAFSISAGSLCLSAEQSIDIEKCAIRGVHHLENMAAAAWFASEIGVSAGIIKEALQNFEGLKFRLQKVHQSQDISFYNDSYATRPDATIGALKSFSEDLALILGGSDKGADFGELIDLLIATENIKACVLIGQTALQIKSLLEAHPKYAAFPAKIFMAESLNQAVQDCVNSLNGNGVVLLSPACASFGMFSNYIDRGNQFSAEVKKY